ncbi:uncharacterized protein LOC129740366 [Uranotaenia lowii]|uniref:uncharacterized protein LOC129740366 n=1 Tax=Uranotaenia lowii TaxID=190385 RepID=UPI0024799715|nr:uncharacterized protein LOC129740366 [Uranotaenia lowii]
MEYSDGVKPATVTENANDSSDRVEAISTPRLNPPCMSDANIESYFLSLEFWFAASGIGSAHDTRRYNIVMAQVPPEKLNDLRTIIETVPVVDKYQFIKAKLIAHFADSQQKRLQRVLSDMPLGDLRPSQLFNDMRRAAGSALSEQVLLDLWATRLPPYIQAAVIASQGSANEKLRIADAILESMGLRNISAIDSTAGPSNIAPVTTKEPSIASLQLEIAQLTKKFEQAFSTRSRSRSRNRSRFTYRQTEPSDDVCWYHRKFGRDARICRQPCSFGRSSTTSSTNQ